MLLHSLLNNTIFLTYLYSTNFFYYSKSQSITFQSIDSNDSLHLLQLYYSFGKYFQQYCQSQQTISIQTSQLKQHQSPSLSKQNHMTYNKIRSNPHFFKSKGIAKRCQSQKTIKSKSLYQILFYIQQVQQVAKNISLLPYPRQLHDAEQLTQNEFRQANSVLKADKFTIPQILTSCFYALLFLLQPPLFILCNSYEVFNLVIDIVSHSKINKLKNLGIREQLTKILISFLIYEQFRTIIFITFMSILFPLYIRINQKDVDLYEPLI